MRILVLGAGGVGAYFGARLLQAGADVGFLVRPARALALAGDGLTIRSPCGDLHCRPRVSTTPGDDAYDLAIVACKAYDLPSAIEAIAPAGQSIRKILPLLNGIAHFDALDQAFGRNRVLGGLAHLSVTRQPDGRIVHLSPYHRLVIGTRGSSECQTLSRLAGLFAAVGVDCRISGDIEQELWEKLVFIATLAGATCAMRTNLGEVLDTVDGKEFVAGLLEECRSIAAAAGYPPGAERLAAYRAQLLERDSPLKSSMLHDIESGKRTEGEHIFGDLIRRGRRFGVSTPHLEFCRSRLETSGPEL